MHDASLRLRWIQSCILHARKWETLRTPERWKAMGQYQRNQIIRGWIYQRDFATGKFYA
jgi:hypothetical protein